MSEQITEFESVEACRAKIVELAKTVQEEMYYLVPCNGKAPIGNAWNEPKVYRANQDAVIDHIARGGSAGIIMTPGLMAFDADTPESLEWGIENLPDTPMKTITSRDADGRPIKGHLYYQIGAGVKEKSANLGGKLDLKLTGQCLAFGPHVNGGYYDLQFPEGCHQDLLPIFTQNHLDMVMARFSGMPRETAFNGFKFEQVDVQDQIWQMLKGEIAPGEGVGAGQRNDSLNSFVFQAAKRGADQSEIMNLVEQFCSNCEPPYTDRDEILKTVKSAYQKGFADRPIEDPEPEEFEERKVSVEYPIKALPEFMRSAVQEIAREVQVDPGMASHTLLGSMAATTQGLFDVMTLEGSAKPTSLYLITVAGSGERKTAAESVMIGSFFEWQDEARERAQDRIHQASAELLEWESTKNSLEKKVGGNPDQQWIQKEEYKDHLANEPVFPRTPSLVEADTTVQALGREIATGWPSRYLVTSEGAQVIGGHSMKANKGEAGSAAQAFFNLSWDSGRFSAKRVGKESASFEQPNGRLTVSLGMQHVIMKDLMANPSARDIGFLARFLISIPHNPVGARLYREREPMPAVDRLKKITGELLMRQEAKLSEGQVSAQVLMLDHDAKAMLVRAYNQWERDQVSEGPLAKVRDVASKSAEQAARIAGVIAGFAGEQSVSLESMRAGIALAQYHLDTFLQLVGADEESQFNEELMNLEYLFPDSGSLSIRDIDKKSRLWRDESRKSHLKKLIEQLVAMKRLIPVHSHQTKKWRLNREIF